jgi:hypothetical protein
MVTSIVHMCAYHTLKWNLLVHTVPVGNPKL